MLQEARTVMRMSPADAAALGGRVQAGEPQAVRQFVLYGAWKDIQANSFIPPRKKASVLLAIASSIEIEVVGYG